MVSTASNRGGDDSSQSLATAARSEHAGWFKAAGAFSTMISCGTTAKTAGRRPGRSVAPMPELPQLWVRRERLEARLTVATRSRLTVVTGPPGAGKTTLLSGWARGCPHVPVIWWALRQGIDDPRRFWAELLGLLRATSGATPDAPDAGQ